MNSWDLIGLDLDPRLPEILSSSDAARVIVLDLAAGEGLTDHEVHERAWIVVLGGEVEVSTAAGESAGGGAGFMAEFAPGERHEVVASSQARLLLLLAPWPGDGHPGAMTIQEKLLRAPARGQARGQLGSIGWKLPRYRGAEMDFELTDRCKEFQERVQAFMDERVYPAEAVYAEQMAAADDPYLPPADHRGAEGGGAQPRPLEPLPPARGVGPGPDQRRVRAAGGDHGPQRRARPRSDELQRAGHRQHGGADPVRHRRAQREVAEAAARRRDPLGLRDDRARRRLLRRDQHRDADRARRRRVRDQRPQVVDDQRAAPQLPGADRDGQDQPRRPAAQAAVDAGRPARHARASRSMRGLPVFGYQDREGHAEVTFEDVRVPATARALRRGRRLRDRPGAARPRPHPPLHALDRRGRAGARHDVRTGAASGSPSASRSPSGPTSRTGSPRRGSSWR